MKQYQVLGDRILVHRDSEKEDSHVLMPHNVKKKPRMGTVVTAGDEVKYVKSGDRVVFNEYAGYFLETTQDLEESDLIVMREDEVLAIEKTEESSCNSCSE